MSIGRVSLVSKTNNDKKLIYYTRSYNTCSSLDERTPTISVNCCVPDTSVLLPIVHAYAGGVKSWLGAFLMLLS